MSQHIIWYIITNVSDKPAAFNFRVVNLFYLKMDAAGCFETLAN
jgi:hypothetical protein